MTSFSSILTNNASQSCQLSILSYSLSLFLCGIAYLHSQHLACTQSGHQLLRTRMTELPDENDSLNLSFLKSKYWNLLQFLCDLVQTSHHWSNFLQTLQASSWLDFKTSYRNTGMPFSSVISSSITHSLTAKIRCMVFHLIPSYTLVTYSFFHKTPDEICQMHRHLSKDCLIVRHASNWATSTQA